MFRPVGSSRRARVEYCDSRIRKIRLRLFLLLLGMALRLCAASATSSACIALAPDGTLFVVNPDSGTVSSVNTQTAKKRRKRVSARIQECWPSAPIPATST